MSMLRKILSLLERRERLKLALLLMLAALSGIAQVTGVGSVMPFVAVLTNPDVIQENSALNWAYDLTGAPGTNTFLVILGAGVLIAFVLSNILIGFTMWFTFRFARWNQYRLSRRLLDAYLHRPYAYYLQRNSADAGTNILMETQTFSQFILVPGMQLVAFGITLLFVAGFLIWLDPVIAFISLAVIGGAYGLIFISFRPRLRKLGETRLLANTSQFKAASEVFGAIKDVKIFGRENAFLGRYDLRAKEFAGAQATEQMLGQLPRYLIEIVAIGSMLLMVLVLVANGQGTETIVPLVSVYAIAGFRLLPAFQFVYHGASLLRANAAVVSRLHADLQDMHAIPEVVSPSERLPFQRAIELRDVTFAYPAQSTCVLNSVSLTVPRGTFAAIIGETGAGKTTLVDIILGLLRPQSGQVLVDGVAIDEQNTGRWRVNVGYVPQQIYLTDDSVAANIAFGIAEDDVNYEAVERAARTANIHDFIVNELPHGYDTPVGERGIRLSGGQRQRIGIARALYHDPEVLVLDEATSALDGSTENAVLEAIDKLAATKTLIVIAHRLTTVKKCDTLFVLGHGSVLAEGSYDDIVSRDGRITLR